MEFFASVIVIFESIGLLAYLQTSHTILLCSCCCRRACRDGVFVYDPEGLQVGVMWEFGWIHYVINVSIVFPVWVNVDKKRHKLIHNST